MQPMTSERLEHLRQGYGPSREEVAWLVAEVERLRARRANDSLEGWLIIEEYDDGSLLVESRSGDRKRIAFARDATVEKLKTELAAEQQRIMRLQFEKTTWKEETEKLQAENATLRDDAERYAHIVKHSWLDEWIQAEREIIDGDKASHDAAIDAARKANG